MHTRTALLLTILLATLSFTGCGEKKESASHEAIQNRPEKPTPPSTFHLAGEEGKILASVGPEGVDFNVSEPVVMVDFFATWCPPCRAEIPHLANLQKKYSGKLKIVGVLVETKHPAQLRRFKKAHGINYFVSNAPDNMLFAARVAEMLHQPRNFSIPFMVIFVKGRYFRHYLGMVPEEMIESDIKEALKEAR